MTLTLLPITLTEDKTKNIYRSDDCQTLLNMWEQFYQKIGYHPPFTGYMVQSAETIVGSCALIKTEDNKRAEISYWTFKSHEGKGIGSWACGQLLLIAKNNDPAIQLFAKTEPRHNASTKILERNGFAFSKIVQDDEIGDAWEWVEGSAK